MQYPESFLDIIETTVKEYPSDIDRATEEAEKKIRALPEFAGFVDALVRSAVRELVYDQRHIVNVRTKKQAGYYGGQTKLNRSANGVLAAYESVYQYHIAGTVLGEILGEDLSDIAANERAIASGHTFNADLCEWLAGLVPEGKKVHQAITEKKLRKEFNRIYERVHGSAARVTV